MAILAMLQNCTGGSRCARRVLVFLFSWALIMIVSLHYRHSSNNENLIIDEKSGSNAINNKNTDKNLASSRYFLDRYGQAQELFSSLSSVDSPYNNSNSINNNNNNNYQPLVDKSPPKTDEELIRDIEERLPSLPIAQWAKNSKYSNQYKNGKGSQEIGCIPRYPSIFDLEFNNIYWQTLRSTNGTFQLFGAYYDDRKLSRIGPAVRIIGMIDRIEPKVKTMCQIWFDNEREPRIVDVLEYKYIWYSKWGNYRQGIYQPYVIACKVPQSHWSKGPPASVSLVEKRCNTATNNLKITYNKPAKKKGFAVCVKGLDFLYDDLSVRLIEWIELIGLLGADKIFFYELQVHANVSKILKHYEKLGKVHVTPLTLPGGQPNIPAFQHMYLTKKTNNKRQNELIPYNDCLYKHMYEFEYIALLDIDEVIMPVQDNTWPELMKRVMPKALKIRNETRASYNVRNVYFLDDLLHSHGSFKNIPSYMHMLQHVYRSKNFTKPNQYIKCFHNPERVVSLHNHFPLACLGAGCTSYPIETEDAQLQHYRADCVKSLKKSCIEYRENSVLDTTIWRYKDKLIQRVTSTLKTLGYFGSS